MKIKGRGFTVSEIICVGTELLTGDTVNTNASFIGKSLMAQGVGPRRQSVVGDNPERLSEDLAAALRRSELVVVTGGLGPTGDDLTKETAAKLLGLPLFTDEKSLTAIEKYFAAKNRVMPEINRKQAMLPKGSVILENEIGTAPGVLFDFKLLRDQGKFYSQYKARWLVLLPGPPREMSRMWETAALPYLKEKLDGTGRLVSHYVTVFGKGESAAAEALGSLLDGENPTVSPYVKNGSVTFRVTAMGATEADAEEKTRPAVKLICEKLKDNIVGTDCVSLADTAVKLLEDKKCSVALAESCTGGLIAKKITDIAGASTVFSMGAVTYSDGIKHRLVGVSEQTLEKFGAVSRETALEMCRGAAKTASAEYGVSVTGLAGPGGGSEENPVGTVWIGVYSAVNDKAYAEKYLFGHGHVNERDWIRELASETALWELIRTVRAERGE